MTIGTVTGSVLDGFDRDAARRRADRIRTAAEELWDTIAVAYQQRDWLALGYASWDEYCQQEFGSLRIRIPREERAEIVASLRDSGLSLRAIEAATGLSTATSRRALAGVSNVTPDREPYPQASRAPWPERREEPEPERIDLRTGEIVPPPTFPITDVTGWTAEEIDAQIAADEAVIEAYKRSTIPAPAKVVGLDGKTYTRTEPSTPRRRPLPDQFLAASIALTDKVAVITRLADDDRFAPNAEKVATAIRSDLLRARDALQRVIDQLPERNL